MWNPAVPVPQDDELPPRLGAGHPALTGMIAEALAGGPGVMLLHIDIDHFASINENMSAEVGDHALALLAQRLQAHLRGRGLLWRHGS
ncbi:diguanylate cyclase, partial [Xanthomonas translucens]